MKAWPSISQVSKCPLLNEFRKRLPSACRLLGIRVRLSGRKWVRPFPCGVQPSEENTHA